MARITLRLNYELLAQIDQEPKAEITSQSSLVGRAMIQYFAAKGEAREEEENGKKYGKPLAGLTS